MLLPLANIPGSQPCVNLASKSLQALSFVFASKPPPDQYSAIPNNSPYRQELTLVLCS